MLHRTIVVSLFVAGLSAIAQAAPDAGAGKIAPTARKRPDFVSPEVAPDRKVTFRLWAPDARTVAVGGQMGKGDVPLTKGADGLWSATLGPIDAGIYEYHFVADGISMIDPSNVATKPQRLPNTSILEIPGTPARMTEFQDVPHGAITIHHYLSKALGRARRLHVYTPPGYEKKGGRYPVLYLLHGSGDNDATWVAHGHANFIFDNLLAAGKAKPMIVVMTDGHAALPDPSKPPEKRGADNVQAYSRDLLEDVMPLVEGIYRIEKKAQSRAIAGLSMGGHQTLFVGLNHPELFAWVGAMSAGIPASGDLEKSLGNAEALNKQLRWFWIGCGRGDFLFERNQKFLAELDAKGIKHIAHITEGDHSWPIWRSYLEEITPQLFVAKTPGKPKAQ